MSDCFLAAHDSETPAVSLFRNEAQRIAFYGAVFETDLPMMGPKGDEKPADERFDATRRRIVRLHGLVIFCNLGYCLSSSSFGDHLLGLE
jgi:hypothetical protein